MTDLNESFERIYNPYVIGNPIRAGEPFFGREDDFQFAKRRLEAEREGIVLLFVGGRRSGKTSIMFQILAGNMGPGYLPVFIDMQQLAGIAGGSEGDKELLERMARIVIDNIADERLLADFYDFRSGSPHVAFDRLLADINQIFADKRLLFLVDEAELLRDKAERGEITDAVLTTLASALENRRVSFFFTGSSGLAEADVAEWKRLMGKGDFREISFLSARDTKRLATEPLDERVRYADGVLDALYQLTYGHPFYTQLICTNAVDHLNTHERYELTADDLDDVVRTIVNNPPPHLGFDWEQFSHEEQLVLALLSEVSEVPHVPVPVAALTAAIEDNEYPIELGPSDLHMLLDGLDAKMVVERSEDGGYHFLVDLVRLWVRRSRSVWRLVEEEVAPPPAAKRWPWAVGAAAVAVIVAVFALAWESPPPAGPAASSPVVSGGRLYVERFPEGTQVRLRGPLDGDGPVGESVGERTPEVFDALEEGRYEVRLTHALYRTRVETLAVAAGGQNTVDGDLERLRGRLTVRPTPAAARVRIHNDREGYDSTAVGDVTVDLATGSYGVEVSAAGYRGWQDQHEVVADERRELTPQLSDDVGTLVVTSAPTGATVRVDDREVGTTPLPIADLRRGRHRVTLRRATYLAVDTTATVRFGKRDTLAVTLIEEPGTLLLRSTPPQARIVIDGVAVADTATPTSLRRRPGTYRVRYELPYHDATEQEVVLGAGARARVDLTLEPQHGQLRIQWPPFGVLIVDGVEEAAKSALSLRTLTAGPHRIGLKGYDAVHEVQITNDSTTVIRWEN